MIKTTVVKEKRMVICELFDTERDAIYQIEKYVHNSMTIYYKPYKMPNHFRAVAVCRDDDEFDVLVGREIAKKRLLAKYYKSKNAAIDRFTKDINNIMFNIVSDCKRNVNDSENVLTN